MAFDLVASVTKSDQVSSAEPPEGILLALANGEIVIEHSQLTGGRPGLGLRPVRSRVTACIYESVVELSLLWDTLELFTEY